MFFDRSASCWRFAVSKFGLCNFHDPVSRLISDAARHLSHAASIQSFPRTVYSRLSMLCDLFTPAPDKRLRRRREPLLQAYVCHDRRGKNPK
jgi:hypothetical protein